MESKETTLTTTTTAAAVPQVAGSVANHNNSIINSNIMPSTNHATTTSATTTTGPDRKDIQEILETDLSCAICQDIYINPLILNCSHSFCKFCVYRWLSKKTFCPQCRVAVSFQAENLALRNIIHKMVQKSSQQFQTSRVNNVAQRKKDEEQQEREGVHRMFSRNRIPSSRVLAAAYPDANGHDRLMAALRDHGHIEEPGSRNFLFSINPTRPMQVRQINILSSDEDDYSPRRTSHDFYSQDDHEDYDYDDDDDDDDDDISGSEDGIESNQSDVDFMMDDEAEEGGSEEEEEDDDDTELAVDEEEGSEEEDDDDTEILELNDMETDDEDEMTDIDIVNNSSDEDNSASSDEEEEEDAEFAIADISIGSDQEDDTEDEDFDVDGASGASSPEISEDSDEDDIMSDMGVIYSTSSSSSSSSEESESEEEEEDVTFSTSDEENHGNNDDENDTSSSDSSDERELDIEHIRTLARRYPTGLRHRRRI